MAKRYGQRPSLLLGITDPYHALAVDEVVAIVSILAEQPDETTAETTWNEGEDFLTPGSKMRWKAVKE